MVEEMQVYFCKRTEEEQQKIKNFVMYIFTHHDEKTYGKQTKYSIQKAIKTKFNFLIRLEDCEQLLKQARQKKKLKNEKAKIKAMPIDKDTKTTILNLWDDKIEMVKGHIYYSQIIQNSMSIREIAEHIQRQQEINEYNKSLNNIIKRLERMLQNKTYLSSGEEKTLIAYSNMIKTRIETGKFELQNNASTFQTLCFLKQANIIDNEGRVMEAEKKKEIDLDELDILNVFSTDDEVEDKEDNIMLADKVE